MNKEQKRILLISVICLLIIVGGIRYLKWQEIKKEIDTKVEYGFALKEN